MAGGVTEQHERVLAAVSNEYTTALVSADRDVTFGRAATATLRIGVAPVYDDVVPRLAGRVFAAGDRVVIENLHDTLAFDLKVGCRPLLTVAPGDWHSPLERTFDIVVAGAITAYELAVTVNVDHNRTQRLAADDPDADPPTGASPELTERQRRILDAYVEPLAGGAPIATHAQVAERLGVSRSTVRVECERIWSSLFLAGVPMRDLGDARDEIVDAWGRHRF
jgi:hypothetical protein